MSSPRPRGPDREGPPSPPPSGAPPEPPPGLSEDRLRALFAYQAALLDALARPAEQGRLFRLIAEDAAALVGAPCALFVLEEGGVLRGRAGAGTLAAQEGELLPVEGSLEGAAALAGEAVRADDPRSDPRGYRAAERGLPAGPALVVPLAGARGAVGVLLFAREAGGEGFGAEGEACARLAAGAAAAAVEGALAFDRARGSRAALESWRASRATASEGGRRLLRALRHELNNPLAAVLGHAQLLEADPSVQSLPHVLQAVRAIRGEGRRMDALTRRLATLESSGDPRLLDDDGLLRLPPDGEEAEPGAS